MCPYQIFYKDDLNYLRGIGCYACDTPEILRVKNAGDLGSQVRCITTLHPANDKCGTVLLEGGANSKVLVVSLLCPPDQVQIQGRGRIQGLHSCPGHSNL